MLTWLFGKQECQGRTQTSVIRRAVRGFCPEILRNNGLFAQVATDGLWLLLWGVALLPKLKTLLENFLHNRIRDLRLKQFPINSQKRMPTRTPAM